MADKLPAITPSIPPAIREEQEAFIKSIDERFVLLRLKSMECINELIAVQLDIDFRISASQATTIALTKKRELLQSEIVRLERVIAEASKKDSADGK